MSDSREQSRARFEAWARQYHPAREAFTITFDITQALPTAWAIWQAAEAETARRCAELVEGQGAIGGHRFVLADAIRKEFPEAFK